MGNKLPSAIKGTEHVNNYRPNRRRFNSGITALQVLHGYDLNGKVALITCAYLGFGFQTARSLAIHGCKIIFASSDLQDATHAINRIKKEKPNLADNLVSIQLNLYSLESVKQFCEKVKSLYNKLDILILNNRISGLPFTKTRDGYEPTIQFNYLSHFYMTLLLRPLLVTGSRVIVVSGYYHRFANLTPENLSIDILSPDSPNKDWTKNYAYHNSNLCNALFARQLAKKLQNDGISVFSLQPNIKQYLEYRLLCFIKMFPLWDKYVPCEGITRELYQQAASTTVYCSTALELTGLTGIYFHNCLRYDESELARNDDMAKCLWQLSVQMIWNFLGKNSSIDMEC